MRVSRYLLLLSLLVAATALRAAPPGVVDLTPVESGPGLLVAEPVPAPGAEGLADFGAGCARIIQFHLGSTPAFGQTPPWFAVDRVRRGLGRKDVRLTAADADAFAAPLGVTHVALGTISGTDQAVPLSYSVHNVSDKKTDTETESISGTPAEIIAGLTHLAIVLGPHLGVNEVIAPFVNPSVADVTALGRMPWSLGREATVADLDAAERLGATVPVAAVAALPAAGPRRLARLSALINKTTVRSLALATAELAWFYPGGVDRGSVEADRFPNNALIATAAAGLKERGSRERMLAAARVVRCAPHSSQAWRYLAGAFGDVSQSVRDSRWWSDIPADEQAFLMQVYPLEVSAARRATEMDPREPMNWNRLANAATFAGDMETADKAMRQALKLDPDHANAYSWALQMYQPKWSGENPRLAEMVSAAAQHALRPADTAVGIAATMQSIGFAAEAKSLLTRTAADLSTILKTHPKDVDTLETLAEAQKALGDRNAEMATRQRMVEAAPKDADAHDSLANVLYVNKLYTEAAAESREAIRLDPKNAQAPVTLAYSLWKLNQYAEAETAARTAVRLDPEKANARYILAEVLGEQDGRTEESLSAYREAVRLSPYWGTALRAFGDALRTAKQYDESEKVLLRAIAVDQENAFGYRYLAMTLRDSRQWDKAAQVFRAFLEREPDSAWAQRNLGDVLSEAGDKDGARAAWKEAVRLDADGTHGKSAKKSLEKNP